MSELKIQHILTLCYMLYQGAKYDHVCITTSSLGRYIKKSQQAASKHLHELEQDQFIERITSGKSTLVKITDKGYNELTELSLTLHESLGTKCPYVNLEGMPVSGMGKGAQYMKLHGYIRQFKLKLGYKPFPGTFNVKLNNKIYQNIYKQIHQCPGIQIRKFIHDKQVFGSAKCIKALLNKSVHCHLIIPERTSHDYTIVELISKLHIKKLDSIKNNTIVSIRIYN